MDTRRESKPPPVRWGQGVATGVGMALAQKMTAARFNTKDTALIDHFIYGIAGDGDMMEGVASEAASLAGRPRWPVI